METINRDTMLRQAYPELLDRMHRQAISAADLQRIATALADGYSFPTNLDRDPPLEGAAPPTARDLLLRACTEGWRVEKFNQALAAYAERRQA